MAIKADSDLEEIGSFLVRLLDENRGDEAIGLAVELLRTVRKQNTQLDMRLQKMLRQQYGRKSEGVITAQLSVVFASTIRHQTRRPKGFRDHRYR